MREHFKYTLLILACLNLNGFGQGNFIVDQQHTNAFEGGARLQSQPMGQSFTPTLTAIDTVFLNLLNADDTIAGSVYINLRSSSITGQILGSTPNVNLTLHYVGIAEFKFPTLIALEPGAKYYLQALLVSGGDVIAIESGTGYSGGGAFIGRTTPSPLNLWFQEGITIVPEPSALWLSLAGAGGLVFWRKRFGSRL